MSLPRTSVGVALAVVLVGAAVYGAPARDARAQDGAEVPRGRAFDAPIRFRHLGVAEGLPHPDVHAIHQDSLGFLWFGTEDGLARYDGAEMRVYRPVPFDTTSLAGTWPVAITEAGGGDLWVLNESGPLNRYSPHRDAFTTAPSDSTISVNADLLIGSDGALWIGGRTGGLFRHDPVRGTTDRIEAPGLGDYVSALVEDGDALWVGTRDAGLARLDGETATPVRLGPSPFVGAMLRGRDGRLWVGTDTGLWVSADGETFEPVASLDGAEVSALLEDPAGDVWIGTSEGLVRLDPATGRAVRHTHSAGEPSSIGQGEVRALFLDRSGTMWAATEAGLSAFAWTAPRFEHIGTGPDGVGDPGVWSILSASDGTLWVGTESGLDGFAPDGTVRRVRSDGTAATIGPGWVMSIFEEASGTLLVGTRRHLGDPGFMVRLDPETGRVLRRFDTSDGLPSDNPWAIRRDRQGRLWVLSGGTGCPARFDAEAGTFETYCLGAEDVDPVATKSFAQDAEGGLWFGTWWDGLVRLDPETGETRQISHDPADPNTPPNNVILEIAEGPDGALWLATYGAGLSRFDVQQGTFRHYHTANSALTNDVVYAVEFDDAGHVWLSTNDGLTRFDPQAETFERFGLEDGLQDLEFNGVVSHRGPDGTLYFGGINGLNRFRPDGLRAGSAPPMPVVTAVTVGGETVQPGEGSALEVAAPYAESVRLGAREREVAFTVAAPGAAGQARYRVRLDGYDDAWHPPGPQRTATYTNLDPGRYTFRVQAATGPKWNGPERTLAVVVTPRWFQTWWLRLLALLAVGGGVVMLVRTRARRAREREIELEATVVERTEDLRLRTLALEAEQLTTEAQAERLREVARLRTRFFTNVSHEFRTPLTLTIGPLEDLDAQPLPDDARQSVDLALRNSRRLLHLTNQLLDAARLEAGEMTLRVQDLDLSMRVRATALSFTALAERRRVAFAVETPPEPIAVWADDDKLDAILVNLLSNAFKFTPPGGSVRVTVTHDADQACVEVRDNGPGIATGDLPHVFDRFYRVQETAEAEGTGIGLSLARDLAQLHGGTLSVESVSGVGSLFTLSLPLGRDHLDGHEIMASVPGTPVAPDLPPDLAPPGDERTTILVADDNADIRAYVRSHLSRQYRVLDAADGAQALETAQREIPDLVVSDVMMPELDGVALVRALRADPETDFIPIILLTAKAEETDVQAGLDAGADDYVVKPFNAQTLQARIDNLIASRHRLRARFGGDTPDAIPMSDDAPDVSPLVASATAAINARIDDVDLTVEDLADALGTTRSTLHRRLKADADMTPSGLIREVRVERGRELLRQGRGTVSEVAYAVGFRSVSHFSRTYRQQHGVPPSADAVPTADARN